MINSNIGTQKPQLTNSVQALKSRSVTIMFFNNAGIPGTIIYQKAMGKIIPFIFYLYKCLLLFTTSSYDEPVKKLQGSKLFKM